MKIKVLCLACFAISYAALMRHDRKFSKRYQRFLAQNPPKFWPFEWMQVALTFFLIGFGIVIIIQGLPERGQAESAAAEISQPTGQAGHPLREAGLPADQGGILGQNVANAEQNTQKILWKDATEFHKTDWFEQQQAKDDFAVQNFPGSPYAKAVEKMRADRELVKLPTRTENSGTTQSATASTPRLISHGLYYHFTDHLGSSNIVTDEAGNIVEATDFYPYGKPRVQHTTDPTFTNKKQFTGKEKDESGLTYFGARYYDEKIGRFTQPDPVALSEALIKNPAAKPHPYPYLNNPQGLNLYAYALNNPVKYVDPTGKVWDTALDAISFALSAQAYIQNPSLWNSAFVVLDGASLAAPGVPAVPGYIKNLGTAKKVLRFFEKVALDTKSSIKSAFEIATLYAKNAFFQQKALKWTVGKAGDSLANLIGHFAKHGTEVGAETVEQYYTKANDLMYETNTYFFKDPIFGNGDIVYFNTESKLAVIVSTEDEIKTFHLVDQENKIEAYMKEVEKIKSKKKS